MNGTGVPGGPEIDGDHLRDGPVKQFTKGLNLLVQVHPFRLAFHAAAEEQELPDQVRRPFRKFMYAFKMFPASGGSVIPHEDLVVTAQGVDDVIEVVGDSAGQRADGLHLRGVVQLLFQTALFRDVLQRSDDPLHVAVGVDVWGDVRDEEACLPGVIQDRSGGVPHDEPVVPDSFELINVELVILMADKLQEIPPQHLFRPMAEDLFPGGIDIVEPPVRLEGEDDVR